MRMPLIALLAAFIISSPALAETFKTPQAALEALYKDKTEPENPNEAWPYQSYYSTHLNALMKADRDNTPDGEVGALDFDPVIAGQDGKATEVRIGKPQIKGDIAKVVVKFRNFDPVTLNYTLVREQGGWKIDDIAKKDGEFPWKLSEIFSAAK